MIISVIRYLDRFFCDYSVIVVCGCIYGHSLLCNPPNLSLFCFLFVVTHTNCVVVGKFTTVAYIYVHLCSGHISVKLHTVNGNTFSILR